MMRPSKCFTLSAVNLPESENPVLKFPKKIIFLLELIGKNICNVIPLRIWDYLGPRNYKKDGAVE